jgi:phenylacetate-CoA ligase
MIGQTIEFGRLWWNGRMSGDELAALQVRKLRALIRHAYEHVPYYRAAFKSAEITPDDIRELKDLARIPVSAKGALREARERALVNGAPPAGCLRRPTSGSTGHPLTVYLTPAEDRARQLLQFRSLLWAGIRPHDRIAVIGPERERALGLNQRLGLFFSRNISPALSLERQICALRETRPSVLWAYPSMLRALLHALDGRLSRAARVRALITSAEMCDETLLEQVRRDQPGVEILNFYGAIEAGRIASECRTHRGLHVHADHVILECLCGDRPAAPGEPGEAVITLLDGYTMPFIRYRLGDLITTVDRPCSCGLAFPLIASPLGRTVDLIRLPSGEWRSPWPILFAVRRLAERIDRFRLVQDRLDRLRLEIVWQERPQPGEVAALHADLNEHLAPKVGLEIQSVTAIEDGARKSRLFVPLSEVATGSSPVANQGVL